MLILIESGKSIVLYVNQCFNLQFVSFQLYNVVDRLSPSALFDLHSQLERLRSCKGAQSCTEYHGKHKQIAQNSLVNATEKSISTTALPTTDENRQINTKFTTKPSHQTTELAREKTSEVSSTQPAVPTTKTTELPNDTRSTELPTSANSLSVEVETTTQKPTELFTKQVNETSVENEELKTVQKVDDKLPSISKEKLERRRRRKQKKAEKNKQIESSESSGADGGKHNKGKNKGDKKKGKNSEKKRRNRNKKRDKRPNDEASLPTLP